MTVYDESFCLKKSDESEREVEYIIMIAIVFEVMIKIVFYGKNASSISLIYITISTFTYVCPSVQHMVSVILY